MNHVTVGVYCNDNDNHKINIVRPEHLESHIEYNKTWRWGRALFVDGVCVNQGYLSDEKVVEWTKRIAEMNIDTSKPSELYW